MTVHPDLADSLGFLAERRVASLAKVSLSTLDAWRRRRTGPPFLLFGNQYLYPKREMQKHLEMLIRQRASVEKQLL